MGNRGFTLVELLVSLLAATVVLAGISSLYVFSQRVASESESQTFLQRQGTLVMDEMRQRILSASALTRGACKATDPNSIGVTNTNFLPNNSPYCFYRSGATGAGTQLLMDTNGGTWNLLSDTATVLRVTAFTTILNDPGVTITFQLSDQPIRGNSMTFTTDLTRRN